MNLREYVQERMELENQRLKNPHLRFENPTSVNEIVELYRTYDGMKRHMRALEPEKVQEYLDNGYAFVGAYYDKQLAGIAISKQLPEDYPYFTLPKNEEKGNIYTLGGLYVRPGFQGLGIASRLSKIVTKGTEKFGKETNEAVGMAYEVSYDNFGSLRILSQHGNYIGFYTDNDNSKEGLTILLYRPYTHETVEVERPNIILTPDEALSYDNLTQGLNFLSNQENIGGMSASVLKQEDGSLVETVVLDNTPNTLPDTTFEMIK